MRPLTTLALVATAIGVPYVATETDVLDRVGSPSAWKRSASESVSGMTAWASSTQDALLGPSSGDINAHQEVEQLRKLDGERFRYDDSIVARLSGQPSGTVQTASVQTRPPVAGAPMSDLRELLRFSWTQAELHGRFANVATVLADTRLRGVRVPVVTGTQMDDLAGTLTLYFDANDRVQRLNLHAFTGDATRLRQVLGETFGMAPEPNLEAGVMTRRWNGAPISLLRLTYAPVVHSDAVHQKLTVFLELNAPDLAYGISAEAARIVHSDRWTGRW